MHDHRSVYIIYILEREGKKERKRKKKRKTERKKERERKREKEKERERDRHMGYRYMGVYSLSLWIVAKTWVLFLYTNTSADTSALLPRPQFPLPRTVPHYNSLPQRFREHIWNVARNAFPGSAALPRNLVSSALPVFTSTRSSYFEPKIKRIHGVLVAAHIRMYVCTCVHM